MIRWIVASLLLVVLAGPYWSGGVDDAYIALAYAWEWLQSGELRWTSGERVEGYSNFAWVGLLRVFLPTGVDGIVLAKSLALASSVALLGLASARLPRTPQGTALLLALALWAPLARWSVDGMETTLYALLLATGWLAVCAGGWGAGMWLLVAGAATRPEGVAYLAFAGLVGVWRRVPGRDRVVGAGAILAFAAYHACRWAWFGELVPTPILVKIAPVPLTLYGWRQVAGELATASGILVAALLTARLDRRGALLALVPLLWQASVVGRASGDWMTGARLILPGVLASAIAWGASGTPRARNVAMAVVALAVAAWAGRYMPVGYGAARWEVRKAPAVSAPLSAYARGIDTPLAEDVVWVVEEVPEGDTVFITDVGMIGNVPGVRVQDMRGLVQREIAEAIASGSPGEEDGIRAFALADRGPSFIRWAAWGGDALEIPDWVDQRYDLREEYRYYGAIVRWYARHDRRPSAETVLSRWQALHARYPSQPLVAWHYALALSDAGRLADAVEVAARWSDRGGAFADTPASLSFPEGPRPLDWAAGRGLGLYWNAQARSRPIPSSELGATRLRFDVDAPGEEGARAEIRVEAPCGTSETVVYVRAPGEHPIVAPDCATDTVRVAVRFTNDQSGGGDRNLYVSLVSRY